MFGLGSAGERGPRGDHGQSGDEGPIGAAGEPGAAGATGARGRQGPAGVRGRSLTWVQALVMFLLIVLIGVVLSVRAERHDDLIEIQQRNLAEQQAKINANAARIAENRYRGCLAGVQIIEKFNAQTRELIEIEKRSDDPLAKERIKAHEKGLILLPSPACQR